MLSRKRSIVLSNLEKNIHCPEDVDLIVFDPNMQGEGTLPKVCYQPEYNKEEWDRLNFVDFMVYRDKEKAQMDFPRLRIIKYKLSDIHKPIIIDEGGKAEL